MSKGMTNEDLKVAVEAMAGQINDAVGTIREAIAEFDIRVETAEREGYVGDLWRTDYSVTGKGAFPVDMLRYAQSWPKDEPDASNIVYSQDDGNYDEVYTVRLTKHHRDRNPNLCEERWESKFKWKVVITDDDKHRTETTRT